MEAPGTQAILCERYRMLVRHHLRRLPGLFTRFTGLFAHVIWSPTWPGPWRARRLPTDSGVCRPLVAGRGGILRRCRRYAAGHVAAALRTGHRGHRFTCFLGVHNFWLPVIVRHCIVGLAFVQALALPGAGASERQKAIRPMRAPAGKTGAGGARQGWSATRGMSQSDFCEAARLLRLVIEHAETSALADLRKTDLMQAQRALVELQTVATRLRGELNNLEPAFNQTAPALRFEKRGGQMVRAALEWIHGSYARPVTLRRCAAQLGVNAAYLSAVFSRSVGLPFKSYLTEVRMEKARELLSDPVKRASEVAYAVGYASEDRFRCAFKKATSLCPREWRETMRVNRPLPT